MLKEFSWNLISSWVFPCLQLFDSCYNFRAKDGRITTMVRSKGWCVKTGRINGRLMIVQCLSIFEPPLFHLIWVGKKFTTTTTNGTRCRTPIYLFGNSLMVLKTSLLLFCCMFVSSIWHFPLNHFSLSAFRPLLIDLVRWLYSWRQLGSWIAFFLALFLSSVNARVASEIQGFFFGL